jgi:hypothetical protein
MVRGWEVGGAVEIANKVGQRGIIQLLWQQVGVALAQSVVARVSV